MTQPLQHCTRKAISKPFQGLPRIFAQDAALGAVLPAPQIHFFTTHMLENCSHCLRALRQCYPRRLKYYGHIKHLKRELRVYELSSSEAHYGQSESQTFAAHFAGSK